MTAFTAIGQLLDTDGLAMQFSQHVIPANMTRTGRNFDVQTRASFRAQPARNVRAQQGERIPVGIGHDRAARIGNVIHLEMLGRHLWAVAHLDYDQLDGPWRFSAETTSSYQRGSSTAEDIEITGLGLVHRSAQTGLAPVRILDGELNQRHRWNLRPPEKDIIENAAEVLRDRRHNRPIQVRGLLTPEQEEAQHYARAAAEHYRRNPHDRQTRGPIWYRSGGKILSVR